MKKFRTYNNETLNNAIVSYKIDGVRAHLVDGEVISRKGKPLYNINMDCEVAEVFAGNWEKTVSLVRTQSERHVPPSYVYELLPNIDSRLVVGYYTTIDPDHVQMLFNTALSLGYEGLVISTDKYYYKVKAVETYDTVITGIVEGVGKYVGKLGAFITPMGKVGTGFTDKQREELFDTTLIGEVVEVEAMSLTPKGMFRHPRFVRIRFDKGVQ